MNDLLHAIGFYCRGPQPHLHRYSRVHSKANIENYATNSKSCVNVSCGWLLFNVWKQKNGFSGSLSFPHLIHTLAQPWYTELTVLDNFDIFHLNLKFIKHQLEAWYHIICMQRQLKSNIFYSRLIIFTASATCYLHQSRLSHEDERCPLGILKSGPCFECSDHRSRGFMLSEKSCVWTCRICRRIQL